MQLRIRACLHRNGSLLHRGALSGLGCGRLLLRVDDEVVFRVARKAWSHMLVNRGHTLGQEDSRRVRSSKN